MGAAKQIQDKYSKLISEAQSSGDIQKALELKEKMKLR